MSLPPGDTMNADTMFVDAWARLFRESTIEVRTAVRLAHEHDEELLRSVTQLLGDPPTFKSLSKWLRQNEDRPILTSQKELMRFVRFPPYGWQLRKTVPATIAA